MKRVCVLLATVLLLALPGLAQSEAQHVAAVEHARNLQACLSGFGYCDHSLLISAETPRVATAEHARNLQACLSGFGYCDHSLLTTPIAAGGKVNTTVTPNTSTQSSPTSVAPQCAENGSCYGDPNANGVPKTVHVDGYYRKDGTYVRGHY